MKKEILVIVLVCLLFMLWPSALALNIDIQEEYRPGETAIVEIKSNFVETLSPNDVKFYHFREDGEMDSKILEKDIVKIGNTHYLYFQSPKEIGNYSLWIEDAYYYEAGEPVRKDLLEYNFTIEGNLSSFSVTPGAIVTDEDINFNVKALKNTKIDAEFMNKTKRIGLLDGQEKSLEFSTEEIIRSTISEVRLSAYDQEYSISVDIHKEVEKDENDEDLFENITDENITRKLAFIEDDLKLETIEGEKITKNIKLMNKGNETLNVSVTSTFDFINFYPAEFRLENRSTREVELTMGAQEEGERKGKIIARYNGNETEIPLFLIVHEDDGEIKKTDETCEGIGGIFCDSGGVCEGEQRIALDGVCCMGECVEENGVGIGRTVAIILIFIVLAVVVFLIYKKVKTPKTSPSKELKDKSKKYEERFKNKNSPKETRGKLSRN